MQTYKKPTEPPRALNYKLLTAKLCIVKVRCYVVLVIFCFSGICTVILLEYCRTASVHPGSGGSAPSGQIVPEYHPLDALFLLRLFYILRPVQKSGGCIPAGLGSAGYSLPYNAGGCSVVQYVFL